jgi:hypothetical protein
VSARFPGGHDRLLPRISARTRVAEGVTCSFNLSYVVLTVAAEAVVKKLCTFRINGEKEGVRQAGMHEVFDRTREKCIEVPECRAAVVSQDCMDVRRKTKNPCTLCRGDIVAGSERLSAAEMTCFSFGRDFACKKKVLCRSAG